MLCKGTSGYICNFEHSGAGAKLQDTVLSIVYPFVGFHHHIYMDNYYNNVKTAELLLQKNTRICGTIRFPSNLKNIILKEHVKTSKNHFNHSFHRNGSYTLVRRENKNQFCCRI
jgi:hypothetical protein